MSLPGMRSTSDFETDERPKNWREGILVNKIRNGAPLFSLTAAMRNKPTDDPEYNWWEEIEPDYTFQVNGAMTAGVTTLATDTLGDLRILKPGDMLMTADYSEALIVVSVTDGTTATVARGQAGTTAGTIADNSLLVFAGSAYREGAPSPNGTSYNPEKQTNFTQIFREPVEWTRTAQNTRLRSSKSIQAEDKRRAFHKHSMGMERAFWLGKKFEGIEDNKPKRWTGGVLERIPTDNVISAGATTDLEDLEGWTEAWFSRGSSEKMGFASVGTLIKLHQIVRKNTEYQWGPSEMEYNLKVRRFHTPAGTIAFTEMPLFGRNGGFLANDLVVIDSADLCYRYMAGADTQYLPNREARGTDGSKSEWLSECGLEVHHGDHHHWVKGITAAAVDT